MMIIRADEHGGPDVLRPTQLPKPRPAAGEVLVDLVFSGVLSIDALLRRGDLPPGFAVEFPWTPGNGGAGVVTEIGADVDEKWRGTRVLVDGPGSYAEQLISPVERLLPVPNEVDLDQAAALLHDGGTAIGLWERAVEDSADRQVVAITPAAGGAGSILVQLAVRAGHRVIAIVGGEAKASLVRSLGADLVIDHQHAGWLDRLSMEHPTVLFDGVGGRGAEALLVTIAPGGTYLNYGNAGGGFAQYQPSAVEKVRVIGSEILAALSTHARAERQARILQMAAAGQVRAHIGGRFALADAAEAHRALEARTIVGKALLDCRVDATADN